jgi:adenylyltransferase/sulfurtransferase
VCGKNPTITQLIDYEQFCGLGRGGAQDSIDEISVVELKAKIDAKGDFLLIDVREPFEYQIASIQGAKLMPLGTLQDHLPELEAYKNKEIVAHCHHGGRSRRALQMLQSRGFKKLKNVAGGIDQWSEKVDPAVARY